MNQTDGQSQQTELCLSGKEVLKTPQFKWSIKDREVQQQFKERENTVFLKKS